MLQRNEQPVKESKFAQLIIKGSKINENCNNSTGIYLDSM